MPPLKKKMSGGTQTQQSGRSLFGDTGVDFVNLDSDNKTLQETEKYKTQYIDIDKIRFYEYNKFHQLDTASLERSIDLVGVLSPIALLTKKDEEGKLFYTVIAGNRRLTSVINLYKKALENRDETRIRKYSKIFSIVLPLGATEDEIQLVYTHTNTEHRPMNIDDMFNHLGDFLKQNEKGEYINLPEGQINVAKELQYKFLELGYNYGLTKIKTYVSIYMAHNQVIREYFIDKILSQKEAYTLSQMPDNMQDNVIEAFKDMTQQEMKKYIKTYNLETKVEKAPQKRSVDVISNLNKLDETLGPLSLLDKIIIVKKEDKFVINKTVDDLIVKLQTLKTKL